MHQSALLGHAVRDAKLYGWDVPDNPTLSWQVSFFTATTTFGFCLMCLFFSGVISGYVWKSLRILCE